MKTPSLTVTILVTAGLAVGAALFIVLAIVTPVGDVSFGLRAWNIKVLLGIAALLFLSFATLVVVRAIGRRSDSLFADRIDADLAMPVYLYPLTREQIHSGLSEAGRLQLPTRAMIAISHLGIELWGRPSVRLLTIPWSEISTVVPTEMTTERRRFAGLLIRLRSHERNVEVVLVGRGLLGIPSREQAVEIAGKIRALRA